MGLAYMLFGRSAVLVGTSLVSSAGTGVAAFDTLSSRRSTSHHWLS